MEVKIIRIDQPELILCEYLEERGLLPGTRLKIVDEAPYNGPFTVEIAGKEIALGREISSRILVLSNPLIPQSNRSQAYGNLLLHFNKVGFGYVDCVHIL